MSRPWVRVGAASAAAVLCLPALRAPAQDVKDFTARDGGNLPAVLTLNADPSPIRAGGKATLSVEIRNPNTKATLTAIAFSAPLPCGATVRRLDILMTTCGGTVSAAPGATSVAWSDGSLAPGAACRIVAVLRAPRR